MKKSISVFDKLRCLRRDSQGAALLEFTLFAGVFFSLLFGIIEFTFAYYQWNAATKAVQFGARLAAVSNPVAQELKTLTGLEDGADPGDPMPSFRVVCDGSDGDCTTTCEGPDSCTYDAAAMNTLVFGRGNGTSCTSPGDDGFVSRNIGMCNLFYRVTPENVIIEYNYTGLGYAGRPAAEYATGEFASHAVPTISVRLTGINFQFFFLAGLMGFDDIEIPGLLSTVTGEDLSGG